MSEPFAAARKRRSTQYTKEKRPGKKPPRKTRMGLPQGFPLRTVIVLLLLLLIAVLALGMAKGKRRRLAEARLQAETEYARLVARHTVDSTRPWIEKYAAENGIEPAFVAAVILRESSYDPMATSSPPCSLICARPPGKFSVPVAWAGTSAVTAAGLPILLTAPAILAKTPLNQSATPDQILFVSSEDLRKASVITAPVSAAPVCSPASMSASWVVIS